MSRYTRLPLLEFALAIACTGCSGDKQSFPSKASKDSYLAVKHTTGDDHYVIRHGNVEIQATCKYSTYTVKGDKKTYDGHCLEPLPIGQQLKAVRGPGDWLFCNWDVRETEWRMGLTVEKEEVNRSDSR